MSRPNLCTCNGEHNPSADCPGDWDFLWRLEQERAENVRLAARVRELETAIHWARMELGDHSDGCNCPLCQTLEPTRRDAP